jgi:hypothetical protein
VNRFLSLTAFAYCPVADLWLAQMQISSNLAGSHCEALLWMNLQELGRGRNIQAIKSDHEASAKAPAHLANCETKSLPSAGTFACLE